MPVGDEGRRVTAGATMPVDRPDHTSTTTLVTESHKYSLDVGSQRDLQLVEQRWKVTSPSSSSRRQLILERGY